MDFSKLDGLVPAVIQDADSLEVLMVGFMNEEALALTRTTGFATFYSAARAKALDEGRDVRQPARGRSTCSSIATTTRCW